MSKKHNKDLKNPVVDLIFRQTGGFAYELYKHKFSNPEPDPEKVQRLIHNIEDGCKTIHNLLHRKEVIADYVDLDISVGGEL